MRRMEHCRSQNTGLWLSPRTAEISRTIAPRICWWLPPVIWPEEEEAIRRRLAHLTREGARHFVCNAPWQRDLFPAELLAVIPEDRQDGLIAVLAQDPRPQYQDDPERVYGMAFAGFDVQFRVADGRLIVCAVTPDAQT